MTAHLDLTKPISAAALARAGACPAQVALVRKHFGSRPLNLTRARLRRATRLGLNTRWLADHLPPEQRRVFNAARAEAGRVYDAARAEAERVYDAAEAEAEWVYVAAMAEAYRVFSVATADTLADMLGLP